MLPVNLKKRPLDELCQVSVQKTVCSAFSNLRLGEHKLDLRCVSTVHRLVNDTLHHLVTVHDDVSDRVTR